MQERTRRTTATYSRHVLRLGWFERRILRMPTHVAAIFRIPGELQSCRRAVVTVCRSRHRRELILAVGQCEPVAEGAIRPQPDLPAADGHGRAGFRRPVDDEFRVNVEPKPLAL